MHEQAGKKIHCETFTCDDCGGNHEWFLNDDWGGRDAAVAEFSNLLTRMSPGSEIQIQMGHADEDEADY